MKHRRNILSKKTPFMYIHKYRILSTWPTANLHKYLFVVLQISVFRTNCQFSSDLSLFNFDLEKNFRFLYFDDIFFLCLSNDCNFFLCCCTSREKLEKRNNETNNILPYLHKVK